MVHADAEPAAYVVAGQIVAAPLTHLNPSGHGEHVEAPVVLLNVPEAHVGHVDEPAAAAVVGAHAVCTPPTQREPAAHGWQLDAPALENWPSGHVVHPTALPVE